MHPLTCQPIAGENAITRINACRVPFARYQVRPRIFRALACVAGVLGVVAATMGQAPSFSWAAKAGGPSQDFARSIAVDGGGDVIATGSYYDSATFGGMTLTAIPGRNSAYVAKYRSSGSVAWAKSIGSADYHIYVYGGAAAQSGDAYITGYRDDGNRMFISKFNSEGDLMWTREESARRTYSYGLEIGRAHV